MPRNDSKDCEDILVEVSGIEVDTSKFTAHLPHEKLEKVKNTTSKILRLESVSFIDIQSMVGFLSFCSQAVRLGRVFIRRLWDFINHYLRSTPRATLRRILALVGENLEWWNKLLPIHNRILFFDSTNRQTQSLYTDACFYGFGGFYFKGTESWEITKFLQANKFCAVVQGKSLPASRKMGKNPDDLSINMHEVKAILLAFQVWTPKWPKHRIKVYTDSTTAYSGLDEFTLKSPSNTPQREMWLLAARWDIIIEQYWMEVKRNGLADALSCFDEDKPTMLYPHWQEPSHSMSCQPPTYPPQPAQSSLNG